MSTLEIRDALLRQRRLCVPHDLCHKVEHVGHLSYMGLVFVEGHSYYSNVAGMLFIVGLVLLFSHDGS